MRGKVSKNCFFLYQSQFLEQQEQMVLLLSQEQMHFLLQEQLDFPTRTSFANPITAQCVPPIPLD